MSRVHLKKKQKKQEILKPMKKLKKCHPQQNTHTHTHQEKNNYQVF